MRATTIDYLSGYQLDETRSSSAHQQITAIIWIWNMYVILIVEI